MRRSAANSQFFRWSTIVAFSLALLAVGVVVRCVAEEPIATIAVVSNPYITTLPPEQIKDENGSVRDFLAKTAPESMEKTVELVNQLKPDALVVLGSLTWSGSSEDFAAVKKYLDLVHVPTFVTPGHRDRLADSVDDFRRVFAGYDTENSVKSVKGVALAFAGDLDRDPDGATARLEEQLGSNENAKAVLLFSGLDRSVPRSKLTANHEHFWNLVERHKIAVRFDPTRYGHQIGYTNTLPIWTVASAGWSARGAITLARVFAERIELAEIADPSTQAFSLTVPNPVRAERMKPATDDPFGCPSYSADLALKPDYTFALVSDPQFDREANRDNLIQKAETAIPSPRS